MKLYKFSSERLLLSKNFMEFILKCSPIPVFFTSKLILFVSVLYVLSPISIYPPTISKFEEWFSVCVGSEVNLNV